VNLLPGTILAQRYRVDALLGEGGMGAVYRVTDWRGVGCALKVMRPEHLADPDIQRRFAQEAQIGMRLQHPNVRQVWDVGVDEYTKLPYLAMELLSGEDLASRLSWRGALTMNEVGYLLSQLCDALVAAHGCGIVHRDLKPENLFLAATYSGEVLKVLDFGIAKVLAGRGAQSSMVIGTPSWMAPEQLDQGQVIGPATDVWAIGLLAFYALTGRSYWPSASSQSPSYGAIIVEVLNPKNRPPASARAAEYGLEGRFPAGALDEWFAACTAIDPRQRFQDAASCWAALRGILGSATGSMVSLAQSPIATLEDEDALVERAIAEIEGRMPGALAAVNDARDSVPSQDPGRPRAKIRLVKGGTPVPADAAARASLTPAAALVHTPSAALVHTPSAAPVHAPSAPLVHTPTPPGAVVWNTPYPPSPQPLLVWSPPAGKGVRFGAAFFDVLLILFVSFFLGILWAQVDKGSADSGVVLLFFLLYLARDVIGGGKSVGKRVFDLDIIDVRTGQSVGLGEALARQIVSLQVVPGLGLIDSILVLVRDDGRRTGDLLLRTQVVKRRRPSF